jgi:Flp pilus assembly protein TadD
VLAETPGDEDRFLTFILGLSQLRAGDAAAARATFQKAGQNLRRGLETVVPHSAAEADLHSALGLTYAGLGEAASAVAEGEKGMALRPTSSDPFEGPRKETDMAMIYALLGDADHAIPILRRLLQIPCGLQVTSASLGIEPVWDSIRDDPRFRELAAMKQ